VKGSPFFWKNLKLLTTAIIGHAHEMSTSKHITISNKCFMHIVICLEGSASAFRKISPANELGHAVFSYWQGSQPEQLFIIQHFDPVA
jgi:hypothetical protein